MKKIILTTLAVIVFAGLTTSANAQIKTCGEGHAIWSADNTKIVNCISKDAWENSQMEAEQRKMQELGRKLKIILQGTKFWDTRGFENGCEWWYPMHCVVKPEWFGVML